MSTTELDAAKKLLLQDMTIERLEAIETMLTAIMVKLGVDPQGEENAFLASKFWQDRVQWLPVPEETGKLTWRELADQKKIARSTANALHRYNLVTVADFLEFLKEKPVRAISTAAITARIEGLGGRGIVRIGELLDAEGYRLWAELPVFLPRGAV